MLSEEDDEYNTDSSLADNDECVKEEGGLGIVGEIMNSDNIQDLN